MITDKLPVKPYEPSHELIAEIKKLHLMLRLKNKPRRNRKKAA